MEGKFFSHSYALYVLNSLRHTIWKYLWQIYSDILSDILSGIVSDVYSAILFVRVQARSTASWARDMAVGSRHPDLAAWHSGRAALHSIHSRRGRREGEEGEEEEEGVAPLLKSRNLHLAGGEKELKMSHSENLQSLPMSYHFGYAKAYAMLTRVEFFLTRNKLRKPLRKVLTRPYARGFCLRQTRFDKALTENVKGGF